MISGLKSLYAVTALSGEPDDRSAAMPYAISLASAAGAHLTASAAALRVVLPAAATSSTASGLVAQENKRMAGIAQEMAARYLGDAKAAGVACAAEAPHLAWTELAASVVRQMRVHDLSILDACANALDAPRGLVDAALFEGGRAAIVVPKGVETFQCRRAIIAWDGSAMASRAVAAAMPLLRAAEEVIIISVSGEKDLSRAVGGGDLAPHLAHHGIRVSLRDVPAGSRGVGEVLRDEASMSRADLLVMGAYKHSRLREWVLGGVTQSMLEDATIPVLMSH